MKNKQINFSSLENRILPQSACSALNSSLSDTYGELGAFIA
jgi:hypothetical protein